MRVHTLDLRFQNTPGIIAAFLVEADGGPVLIETGPGSTLPVLLEQIKAHGFTPEDIKHVFVTHIHLDHAGAAGWWAQQGATVYVHPRGAQHLIDPSKLMASAAQVYGDRLDSLWGQMLPAPADKVVVLKDGESVKIGKTKFIALDTPGHAKHHHAFLCGDVCFTGDVAGVRLEESGYLSVAAAPPQFDPVAYSQSIAKLDELNLSKLYLTHFGEITDVAHHMSQYALRVEQVHECIEDMVKAGVTGSMLRHSFTATEAALAMEEGVGEELWERYQLANSTQMCADGIALCVEKQG
jgi:glyoxylase-like metal-dependent hydrolase (beta-lactamase superfamily II)